MGRWILAAAWLMLAPMTAVGGEADVVEVKVRKTGPQTFSFDVTVRHGDTGWEHYANKWDVISPDGKTVFGTRTLFHPHEDEQPFTRSLSGVRIPTGVDAVLVRAHDSVHGTGGKTIRVKVPR